MEYPYELLMLPSFIRARDLKAPDTLVPWCLFPHGETYLWYSRPRHHALKTTPVLLLRRQRIARTWTVLLDNQVGCGFEWRWGGLYGRHRSWMSTNDPGSRLISAFICKLLTFPRLLTHINIYVGLRNNLPWSGRAQALPFKVQPAFNLELESKKRILVHSIL